jgi:signal transduction histidine kinase
MSKLATIRLFRDLDTETLRLLEAGLHTRSLGPGETVFCEGDPGDGVYALCEGRVRLMIQMNECHRFVLAEVAAGEIFGEMAVLDGEPRSATAVADTSVTVCFVAREQLLAALHRSPALAIGLVHEISARLRRFTRRHVEEALKAERMNMLGTCVRSIVHDLRNPLSSIRVAVQLAAGEGASVEKKRFAYEQIDRQVSRLDGMTSELLEFSRDARASAILAAGDYCAYLRDTAAGMEAELTAKGIRVEVRSDPGPIPVRFDPKRLAHVFYNLFDNAAAAMPGGGRVLVEVTKGAESVRTRVQDSGSGIAPEVVGQLFEPFVTFGKTDGTGLGLAICRKIVQDHGGTIQADNAPEGGAVFHLELPLAHVGG